MDIPMVPYCTTIRPVWSIMFNEVMKSGTSLTWLGSSGVTSSFVILLVYLVFLVYLVTLVCLVYLVYLVIGHWLWVMAKRQRAIDNRI